MLPGSGGTDTNNMDMFTHYFYTEERKKDHSGEGKGVASKHTGEK